MSPLFEVAVLALGVEGGALFASCASLHIRLIHKPFSIFPTRLHHAHSKHIEKKIKYNNMETQAKPMHHDHGDNSVSFQPFPFKQLMQNTQKPTMCKCACARMQDISSAAWTFLIFRCPFAGSGNLFALRSSQKLENFLHQCTPQICDRSTVLNFNVVRSLNILEVELHVPHNLPPRHQ